MAWIKQGVSSLRTFPWISLMLLLLAYIIVGKFLSGAHVPWAVWVMVLAWVLLLSTFFMSPLESTRSLLYRWMQTDRVAFVVLTIAAALISVVLLWWNVFLYVLVIFAAEALARLDIQNAKCTSIQAFWILTLTSCSGLGLGWLSQYLHQS